MPKFTVEFVRCRKIYESATAEIEADNEEAAETLMPDMDCPGDWKYTVTYTEIRPSGRNLRK